tara:strand:+ start:1444 stop:2049 length:606 start_codon:yes stop_codon:yes gene_type:complete
MIIIDDYLDEDFLKELSEDKEFWKIGYQWWNGWWSSPVENNRHKLIKKVWGKVPSEITLYGGPVAGFEHWVGITSPDGDMKEVWGEKWSLAPHTDKDEKYWEEHPRGKLKGNHADSFKHPIFGTIFYVEEPEEGGYLKYWSQGEHWRDIDENTPCECIRPKKNRLIIFDASKTHAVTAVTKGIRKAVAINLWGEKPEQFDE